MVGCRLLKTHEEAINPTSAGFQLLDAINRRDLQRAQGLLLAKADPNSSDSWGRRPLHLAAAQGVAGLIRALISHKALLDAPEGGETPGRTALHLAVRGGWNIIVRLLLEARAEPNCCDADGETPLMTCVSDGNMEAMKMLLESGAKIDIVDAEEGVPTSSALLRAVERENVSELVEFLVKSRANVAARDKERNQPLHLAIMHGDARLARMLLQNKADPDSPNQAQRTPLHCAAGMGAGRIIQALVEHRANVDQEDAQGMTPLHLAANSPTKRQLINLGAHDLHLVRSMSMPAGNLVHGGSWAGGPDAGGVFPAGRLRVEASGSPAEKALAPLSLHVLPLVQPSSSLSPTSPSSPLSPVSPGSNWRRPNKKLVNLKKAHLPHVAWQTDADWSVAGRSLTGFHPASTH